MMTIDHPRTPWHANPRTALARLLREMKLGEVRICPRSRLRLEREMVRIGSQTTAEFMVVLDNRSLEIVFVARRVVDGYNSPDAVPDALIVDALLRLSFDPMEASRSSVSPMSSALRAQGLPRLCDVDGTPVVICLVD